ncbi:DNA-binding IclR family transcriptional regulator [Microbacterium endophyticum]|uniref:DNA-binding IclR family transcriptional regulator n=1 Tax=Microbacterium endophyticum TaxID=1526412 RepID=A0A7W4V2Q2_9MICO|nr:IclR family transcriptional regulator [Microbacterium endophyticum]MBB2975711.1 DNA-binding IclR family transcriptional regulator [Microbacterium endophyticum]NIK36194.1 DNA-binding IclR family transcriptional regulator [Microbacterium endophyticum]
MKSEITPAEGVLSRAARLLRAFTADDDGVTAATLAVRTGLSRSTAHRLAVELTSLGMLDRRADGSYAVGTGIWEIGELAAVSARLRERALPHMLRLYEATGENVHVAVLSSENPADAEALYVARVTGPHSIPTLSRVGGRHPLHTTGVGKALIAQQDDEWIDLFLLRGLQRETVHSITDAARFRQDVVRARERGFATTRQEMTLGNVSIAVAIPPLPGLPLAALGIVTHMARADEARLAPLVVAAAGDIARAVEHH